MRISRISLAVDSRPALLLLAFAALVAPAVKADSLFTDSISFPTFMYGPAPTAGTFTYDLDTQTFMAFSVTWDGLNFDLTSAANSFGAPPCAGGISGGAAAFALLNGACSAPNNNTGWTGSNIFGQDSYEGPYFLFSTSAYYIDQTLSRSIPNDGQMAEGTFAITAAGTLINFEGGSSSAPVLLQSGLPVGEVTGTIGGDGSQDYYLFSWGGGAFSAKASITGAPSSNASYSFTEGAAGACGTGTTVILNNGDGFTSPIEIADLPAGQYCIGINADNANDPAFALTFSTPIGVATPEPSGFVSILACMGTIGVLGLLRKHAQVIAAESRLNGCSSASRRRVRRLLRF